MIVLLAELFYWLLNMSIASSVIGVVVWAISWIRPIPRRVVCLLWAIPFLRMWLPIGLPGRVSLMSALIRMGARKVPAVGHMTIVNFTQQAQAYTPLRFPVASIRRIFSGAGLVWLTVFLVLAFWFLLVYRASAVKCRQARRLRSNIYLCPGLSSPMVQGVFRSKILLPQEYSPEVLEYILLHEQAHIRRRDNLWRLLGIASACLHWFNPLSWLFLKEFLSSLELACDEAVLRRCPSSKAYAAALLSCAHSQSLFASSFGGAGLPGRIQHILSYRRLSLLGGVAVALFAAALGYVLLTN